MRFVSLSSATGRYGGPSDSALRQAQIAAQSVRTIFMSGYLKGDKPQIEEMPNLSVRLYQCKPLVRSLPFPTLFSARGLWQGWKAVGEVDVVHISMAREAMPIALALISIVRSRRLIVQPHGMLTTRAGKLQTLLDLIVKPIAFRSNVIVGLTGSENSSLRAWLADGRAWMKYGRRPEIVELHNPIIGLGPVDIASGEVQVNLHEVLFVGRLHRRKRIDVFANAAIEAKRKGWSDKYSVVGPDEGELSSLLENPHVAYEGPVSSDCVCERVSKCLVFMLPSSNEPWGNVLALAIALGKPVVVSRSAAMAPLVESYEAGIIVDDGDAAQFAQAAHRLLTDMNVYQMMSDGAKRLTRDRFGDDFQLENLDLLYHSG